MRYFAVIFCLLTSTIVNSQTDIPIPGPKDIHPEGYYQTWIKYLPQYERILQDDRYDWHEHSKYYFNRFLMYAKMQTENSSDILSLFMDGYNFDKHYFCHRFQTVLPLNGDEYKYLWKIYHREKPVMDELCACIRNSYSSDLRAELKEIKERDQRYRKELDKSTIDQLKSEGKWQKQLALDKQNVSAIKKIIEKYGYPGRSQGGYEYEEVAFLVIQHSDLEYMQYCLPLIEQAIQSKNLRSSCYAYLYDRIQMLQQKPQKYGTQYLNGKLYPLEDAENVDQLRFQLGLGVLQRR